jgi:hypothetical protein
LSRYAWDAVDQQRPLCRCPTGGLRIMRTRSISTGIASTLFATGAACHGEETRGPATLRKGVRWACSWRGFKPAALRRTSTKAHGQTTKPGAAPGQLWP